MVGACCHMYLQCVARTYYAAMSYTKWYPLAVQWHNPYRSACSPQLSTCTQSQSLGDSVGPLAARNVQLQSQTLAHSTTTMLLDDATMQILAPLTGFHTSRENANTGSPQATEQGTRFMTLYGTRPLRENLLVVIDHVLRRTLLCVLGS